MTPAGLDHDEAMLGVLGPGMLAMTLGVAALVNPLRVEDADLLHIPMLAILVALGGVLALAARHRCLDRREGVVLLAAYPAFVLIVLLA